MDELGAELDGNRGLASGERPRPTADAVARLEHEHREAVTAQLRGCREARHSGTHHHHVDPSRGTAALSR